MRTDSDERNKALDILSLETELLEAQQSDSRKTTEINVLVAENRKQAAEIERLNAAMLTGASILERDGDEHSVGAALRRAMTPNAEIRRRSRPLESLVGRALLPGERLSGQHEDDPEA